MPGPQDEPAFALHETTLGLTRLAAQSAVPAVDADTNWTGRHIGPYRIERPLGQGGMGSVYLAVRDDDQFHKEVAIKTLKFELESGSAVSRFRHERQILAHLEHPNIARLLDGGTTEQGTPYIVLEYVAGMPITEWCDRQQLSIDQRLRLFRQVCDAVQYAHQNLIVHRDIKPGNILATPEGIPKLLDFGIAKLLDAGGGDTGSAPTLTATGTRMMTPDYASPEQVRGAAVSTASDVYSLGGVLYRLLTGQRPHALQNYDAVEIARVVCDTEIRPPSTAGNRRLRGDLDNIVMKAMQKVSSRRYASVVELSEDIRRYLEGLPVAARRDTAVYRTKKFVRRHAIGVSAAAAVVVSLIAGVAVSLHEAHVAERRFAQVRELASTFLFQFYDQVTPLTGSTAVRASIVDTARKYLDGLSQEAGDDASLIVELAQAYERLGSVQGVSGANLGQIEDARRSYQRALDLYARLPVNGQSPADLRRKVAGVLMSMASIEFDSYHENVAESLMRRMLTFVADPAPDSATRLSHARGELFLGDIRLKQGHAAEAVVLMESAKQAFIELQSSEPANKGLPGDITRARERLARAKVFAGDLDGAAAYFLELLETSKPCAEQGPLDSACAVLGTRLERTGDVYAAPDRPNLQEPGKAAVFYERAMRIQERIAALDPNNRKSRFDLAARYGKLGDSVWRTEPTRALDLYERALATARTLASKEQVDILHDSYLVAISRPLIQLGRTVEARKALTEAIEHGKTDAQSSYADRLGDIEVRGIWPTLLVAEGNRDEARRALTDLIRDAEALRSGHPDDLTPIFLLSESYRLLASISAGQERRDALLHSAGVWHSWPATGFTKREEQKDLTAASGD